MIPENPSRSARKRKDDARQSLALRLVALTAAELARLKLDTDLVEAIRFAASRPKRGSRRREMLHVGALLRLENADEIEESLINADFSSRAAGAVLPTDSSAGSPAGSPAPEQVLPVCSPQVLRWKDALLKDDGAVLEEILGVCPQVDLPRLRQLARNLRKKSNFRSELRLAEYLIELEAECL